MVAEPAIIRRAEPEDGPAVRDFVFATLRSYGIEPDPEGLDADVPACTERHHHLVRQQRRRQFRLARGGGVTRYQTSVQSDSLPARHSPKVCTSWETIGAVSRDTSETGMTRSRGANVSRNLSRWTTAQSFN